MSIEHFSMNETNNIIYRKGFHITPYLKRWLMLTEENNCFLFWCKDITYTDGYMSENKATIRWHEFDVNLALDRAVKECEKEAKEHE